MKRTVQPELLDELPRHDPGAIRSRQDIRRLNAWMGNSRIMANALRTAFRRHLSLRIVDLGAGDGEFLLRVARRLRGQWRCVDATLVDQHDLLRTETQTHFKNEKWSVTSSKNDVFRWLRETDTTIDAFVINLFLHHLHDTRLRDLFQIIATKAEAFIAIEPRRARWPLFCSRWLSLIGCNQVTCHDAPISVRAGFNARELSALWPDKENWELSEGPAGLFSHLFVARRRTNKAHLTDNSFVATNLSCSDVVDAIH